MIKVYVAGAYSADNVIDVLKNIGKGEFAAGQFCPLSTMRNIQWR